MIVQKPRKPGLLKRILLLDLLRGLKVTLINQMKPHTTIEYPRERPVLRERFRGLPRLRNHPETGEELCIACGQCATICPTECITVEAEKKASGKGKQPKSFVIDYERCCVCGFCAEICPTKPETAIYMSHDYELASYERDIFKTEKEILYKGHKPKIYKR
jgi:NADH-quinone oxidoreductase chain I